MDYYPFTKNKRSIWCKLGETSMNKINKNKNIWFKLGEISPL